MNNRFGHPAGNDFLREIARALQNAVRESDIAFRYGGDEFVLALPATATDGARHLLLGTGDGLDVVSPAAAPITGAGTPLPR